MNRPNKDILYLQMAFVWAENSYAIRRKVGCLVVKDGLIISDGYNGTPSGFPNVCEYAVSFDSKQRCEPGDRAKLLEFQKNGWDLVTYPIVLHAESNALTKLARSGNSSNGATLYCTDEPCIDCAKLMIQSGIVRVVYSRPYHNHSGVDLLKQAGVAVDVISIKDLISHGKED